MAKDLPHLEPDVHAALIAASDQQLAEMARGIVYELATGKGGIAHKAAMDAVMYEAASRAVSRLS